MVIRAGAGYDNIDYVYARSKDIDVMNTPGANSNAVAEEVIAMILAAYRFVIPGDVTTRAGEWNKKKYMGRELTRKTVGILGLGNIGRLLVKRLQGFECTVLGYDHFLSRQRALNIGATPAEMEEIFTTADIISIHVPGGPATRNLINADLIRRMKDGAMLVNCARYGVVDEDALLQALRTGQIAAASLDVFREEPLPASHPFWGMENVHISAHMSGDIRGWRDTLALQFHGNLQRGSAGRDLVNVVDKQRGYVSSSV